MLAAGLLLAGCKRADRPPGGMPGGPAAVSVITVKAERVEPVTELSGRVAASLTAEVRPQVGGILRKRLFTEGADVKQGDLLYEIDPATYRAALDGAKAALAKAGANVEPLRLKAERYAGLLADEAVSKQDYEDAAAAHQLALAEVEAAKAALETARINLDFTRVTAPISGRIGRSAVTDGALVTAGQTIPLATIQQLDPVFVDVTQSSAEMLRLRQALESGRLSRIKGEAKVGLLLDDGSKYDHAGTMKFSEAFVDPGTGSVTLRSLFPNPKLMLLPGMFVRAALTDGVVEQGILVPQRAVTRTSAGGAMVMLANQDDAAEPRSITVDRTVGDMWLVSAGLKPGDRVIMEGLQRARPGTPLTITPYAETPHAAPGAPPAGSPGPAKVGPAAGKP
jgi:membrane fusion protein (multidrug efflux system)